MPPGEFSTQQFRSCLLVSSGAESTLRLVRAFHGAGFAVLERQPSAATVAFAQRGDFDLVAWIARAETRYDTESLGLLASARVPVVSILAEATPQGVTACLHAGADACIQLDADERVVVAQVHAVLRRYAGKPAAAVAELGALQVGDLSVDTDRCEVARAGHYVPLTASEFRIVEHMARSAGKVLRAHDILNAVSDGYTYGAREAQDVFKVYVRRIRRKLEPCEEDPRYLVTVRGFGYRLEGGEAAGSLRQRASQTA